MRGVGKELNWSRARQTAAKVLLGPQRLDLPEHPQHKKLTVNSVLLGLGISWTCLSLLNAFCASGGELHDRSFCICGDDALGLWNKSQQDAYKTNMENAKMKLNMSKSYIGFRFGVFCERLVRRFSPPIFVIKQASSPALLARRAVLTKGYGPLLPTKKVLREPLYTEAKDILGLREAAGARLFFRRGRTGVYSVREHLTKNLLETRGRIRALVKQTLRRSRPKGTFSGPTWLGGNGGEVRTVQDAHRCKRAFVGLLIKKGTPLQVAGSTTDAEWCEMRREIRGVPTAAAGPHQSTVLEEALIAKARDDVLRSQRAIPKEKRLSELRQQSSHRERVGRNLLQKPMTWWGTVYPLLQKTNLTSRGRKAIFTPLKLSLLKATPRRIKRVLTTFGRHQADPTISGDMAALTLHELGLSSTPLQNGKRRPWAFLMHSFSEDASSARKGGIF
jgi:hypothetical protein